MTVTGDACLAGVLQGLTRARLTNPPRFIYRASNGASTVIWHKNARSIKLTIRSGVDMATARTATEQDLFDLKVL